MVAALHSTPGEVVRFRARVAYDGTDFAGMQYQANARGVANVLQGVLAKRLQLPNLLVTAAGRTDTGVHARGQAVHFDVPSVKRSSVESTLDLERSINLMLPDSVRVHHIEEASESDVAGRAWHSIYWATGKQYDYRFYSGLRMDPQQRFYRHSVSHPIDVAAMSGAAAHLIGEHDFASFANKHRGSPTLLEQGLSTTRVVRNISIIDEGGGYYCASFHVKGALYKQVRNMMGFLLLVGGGRSQADEVPGLLAARNRDVIPPPAPAHGLTLESVYYNVGWSGAYSHPLHTDTVGSGAGNWQDGCGEAAIF